MNIFVIAAWLAIPLSIWLIVYFGSRIIMQHRVRRDLGNAPSEEELRQWYEQNYTDAITHIDHSPTREKISDR